MRYWLVLAMLSLGWVGRAEPPVATVVSVSERAVDDDGNGLPDRLEITALLNVVKAGKYGIRFMFSELGGGGLMVYGEGHLALGSQKLKATVTADQMRQMFRDGPFTIDNLEVYTVAGDGSEEYVTGVDGQVKTAAYSRHGWDRGAIFGEEEVRLRPVRAGKRGKFRALEVDWEAVTTGGVCQWTGELSVGKSLVKLDQRGELRPGKSRFVFEFDAGGWAKESGKESTFHGYVDCIASAEGSGTVSVRLRLNPREFEFWDSPLAVTTQSMLQAQVGRGMSLGLAELRTLGTPPVPVQYRLASAPKGLTVKLMGAKLQVAASGEMRPGRHYVEVEAVAGQAVGTGTVVVDVVTPLPLKPIANHSVGVATARGVRPDEQGRFRTLEVLWPVKVPGGDCGWGGLLTSEGATPEKAMTRGSLPKGESVLSLAFPGSIIGNSGKSSWLFHGEILCGKGGPGQGAEQDTRLVLEPATFARRPGLPLLSWMFPRLRPGKWGPASVFLESPGTEKPVFRVLNMATGIEVKRLFTSRFGDHHMLQMEVWVDQGVEEGRYYLPVMVTLGSKTGTAEVVVDVVRE